MTAAQLAVVLGGVALVAFLAGLLTGRSLWRRTPVELPQKRPLPVPVAPATREEAHRAIDAVPDDDALAAARKRWDRPG